MLKNIVFIILSSFILGSCMKGETGQNCNYDPCAKKASENEIQAVQTYLTSKGIQAEKHCSGLFYRIENAGTGNTAGVCDGVAVNYRGSLTNGNVFETRTDATNPVAFQLGGVITGWINGIPLIKEGGRIILYIPPSLAYGNSDRLDQNGQVVIPGGSILIFEIDLRQVIK